MKKQYQNPDTFTMSFSVDDIVMQHTLSTSVVDTESINVPIESAPKKFV